MRVLAFVSLIFILNVQVQADPADRRALPIVRQELSFLTQLPNRQNKRVISGQLALFPADQTNLQTLYKNSGVDPGLLGTHYGLPYVTNHMNETNAALISHWKKGGLVTIGVAFDNPLTGGRNTDTTYVNIAELLKPGSSLNTKWLRELDVVANGLKQLQDNGVAILFRPFHEMNGDWFWWSVKDPSNEKPFVALWKQVFVYFTEIKGLHNLLWVYSPNANRIGYLKYYPGASYVDVVGLDFYSKDGSVPKLDGYDKLLSLRKPFALTEFGPESASWNQKLEPRDYAKLINGIKNNMPQTVYWMAWNGIWGMDKHLNVKATLNDPWVLNCGDLAEGPNSR